MALKIGEILIYSFGYVIIAITLIPLIRNDNWAFRIFEYPRAQKLLINLVILALFLSFFRLDDTHAFVFIAMMGGNALYLFYQVFPYTRLAGYQLKGKPVADKNKHFRLLVCNVFQDNRDVQKCLQIIDQCKPDIIILVETNAWWKSRLAPLDKEYAYQVSKPLENTYGMLLYSKLELVDPEIKFLVKKEIPSIHTKVRLTSGDLFYLYCLHPQPPVPAENPRSTERDAEILTIAKEAKACSLPAVVAGDLNDVAWSYTTELFMKVSGLLDPRRGRGFFNTFHARYLFLRWPLDHIFCSKHFQLAGLRRLPAMGSDHFPIFVELALDESKGPGNQKEELEADAEDMEMAEEKVNKAR